MRSISVDAKYFAAFAWLARSDGAHVACFANASKAQSCRVLWCRLGKNATNPQTTAMTDGGCSCRLALPLAL